MGLRAGLVALNSKAVLNLAVVLSLWSTSALAVNITFAPWGDDPAHAIVIVEGRLESGDEIEFRTQVGRLTKAIVRFSSDGGDVRAGIEIGKIIRMKSFATAVESGKRCASACALAWLGGSPRYMGHTAHVGFHAAYIKKEEGTPSESGVWNALVGSYLTQIGLSENAVFYITKATPTEMTWLTLRDAEKNGIEVLPFVRQPSAPKPEQPVTSVVPSEQQTPAPTPAPPVTRADLEDAWDRYLLRTYGIRLEQQTPAPTPAPPVEQITINSRALSFVKYVMTQRSDTDELDWLGPLYADKVIFHGRLISRGEVVAAHRLFIERWPERSYTIQDKSMNAVCGGASVECIVTGTVEWETHNAARNAAAGGLAGFTYVLRPSRGVFIIKAEKMLQRRPQAQSPPRPTSSVVRTIAE